MDRSHPQEGRKLLDPSALGTKEYWEAAYAREIDNNKGDADDEGVIWFEESDAEATVLKKLAEYSRSSDNGGGGRREPLLDRRQCRFLDLGTGNGHMLFALREDEYEDDDEDEGEDGGGAGEPRWARAEMVGIDYSAQSIQLARQLDVQRRQRGAASATAAAEADYAPIRFEEWDLLSPTRPAGDWLQAGFDVVLDKGTFDAISLMPHHQPDPTDDAVAAAAAAPPPHPCALYRDRVARLVKPGKFLCVTSCNWTTDELADWLVAPSPPPRDLHPVGKDDGANDGDDGDAALALELFDEARYPTFTFGGQTGQSVVTAIFRRPAGRPKG